MGNIRIVTDSTADIPASLRESLGIEMVPLKVHFGNDTCLDQVDITSDLFYERLEKASTLPTTSQPSPVDFVQVYERILNETPDAEIISVHLSSAFSGTYQSAVMAKALLEGREANITTVDSKSASYGFGMLVVALAEAANAGRSKEDCMDLYYKIKSDTKLYFLVDTLDYLQKGGRIGKASALVGSLLQIKPILTIDESGEISPVDKVRGQKRAMARILELLQPDFADASVRLTIAHSNAMGNAEQMAELVASQFDVKETLYTEIGPVIGTHVGPGTIGLFVTKV